MDRFAQYLSTKRIISDRQIPFFIHWVRQCYAFCRKTTDLYITSDEIDGYLKHISKQKQSWQVDQARMAIELFIFYKNHQIKNRLITAPATNQWKNVKNEMIKIIRFKHLSVNTEKTYIGWLRTFCRFLKAQNPHSQLLRSDQAQSLSDMELRPKNDGFCGLAAPFHGRKRPFKKFKAIRAKSPGR
jgi:hypothetical protein